jgi:hypothetical protein
MATRKATFVSTDLSAPSYQAFTLARIRVGNFIDIDSYALIIWPPHLAGIIEISIGASAMVGDL